MRAKKLIPDLKAYMKEHKLNAKTRLDGLALTESNQEIFVEVKNVTLANPSPVPTAHFPDSLTERGQKHLIEMISLINSGKKTLLIFVVQRSDCERFAPAVDLDPDYAKLFDEYLSAGGEAMALSCRVSQRGVQYLKTLPIFKS
jgi:sugar fermentation stimulation protein A